MQRTKSTGKGNKVVKKKVEITEVLETYYQENSRRLTLANDQLDDQILTLR